MRHRVAATLATLLAASTPAHALRLLAADTAGSGTTEFALPAQPMLVPVTQVRLRFDTALAPLSALLPGTFRVVAAGADDVLSTVACGLLPASDDVAVSVLQATLHDAGREVALHLVPSSGLPRGNYRVLACDSLLDLGGIALDGNDDGLPGGVASRDFTVLETSQVENPGFDDDTAGWSVYSPGLASSSLQRVAQDADGALSSGAMRLASNGAFAYLTAPVCLDVGWRDALALRTRFRYRVLQGSVRIFVTTWSGFTGDTPGDTGCYGPGVWREQVFAAAPTPAFATFDSGWLTLPDYPLADVSIRVSATDGQPYEILFDDVGFSRDSQLIFRDTFLGY